MHSDCPSGIRHVGGAKLNLALVWNVRTWPAMLREKAQAAPTARPKVPMRRRGADCPVVVRHRLCRTTANETLVSHCRVVGIELQRRVCFFVVLKRGNARGAKGAGHRRWERANWQQEGLQFSTEG